MKVGVNVRNFGGFSAENGGVQGCLTVARRAEELGFDSVWVADHIVVPAYIRARYPHNATGAFGAPFTTEAHEPLILVSALARVTQRVDIGVAVLVIPYRHPLVTAKILATADRLSGGRIILG